MRKFLSVLLMTAVAFASSQGPVVASSATGNTATVGGGTVAWTSPTNIQACDSTFATLVPGTATTDDLRGGIVFTIPTTATIVGLQMDVFAETPATTNVEGFHTVDIESPSGTLVTTNQATAATLTTTNTDFTFGGPTSLWGTTWTPSQINGSFVGNISLKSTAGGPGTVEVDCMEVTVFFTVPTNGSGMLKVFSQTRMAGKPERKAA